MFGRIKTKLRNNAKGAKYLFTNLGWTNWQTFLYGEKCSSTYKEHTQLLETIKGATQVHLLGKMLQGSFLYVV